MNQLSRELARAVEACDREPIHRPGAIQPHGALLKLGPEPLARGRDAAVLAASANAPGGDTGSRLADHLDAASTALVAALLEPGGLGRNGGAPLPALVDRAGRRWSGTVRREAGDDGATLLDLEPIDGAARDDAGMLARVDAAAEQLRHAPDLAAAATSAVDAVRALIGFDRVMAYRFEADWNGVVIAESLSDPARVASFAGLRFPATDIPAQARALYRDERIRLIPDALAVPVPMRGAPVDMSRSALRAVSPVHLAYLGNMGVRASMSVALLDEAGELWGLLACHHETEPRCPGGSERAACAMIARALGARVASLAAADVEAGRARVTQLRERLVGEIVDPEQELVDTLRPLGDVIAAALDAHAIAIVGAEGTLFVHPASSSLPDDLSAGLDRLAPDGVLVRDDLARADLGPAGPALAAAGHAGIVAHRLSAGESAIWAVWLRPERKRDVAWAGNPDKQTIVDAGGLPALTPRRSFATWIEQVGGRSAPFGAADTAAAAAIAESFGRALLRRSAAVERANRELVARNEQIRFFADAAVHDLREPLWQIQVFAGVLRENLRRGASGDTADGATAISAPGEEDDASLAAIIERSSARMRELLDGLARFAAAGADPDRLRPVPLIEIVEEARADMAERLASTDALLRVAIEPDLVLLCDQAQVRRVVQNLLSNSVKYRRPDARLAITVTAARQGARVVIDHVDNGTGFSPADRERIFEPFRRLGRGQADDGDGSVIDGLGLGLAICRRIVEGHGGTITADGSPGAGARFTVTLPEAGATA